MSISKKPYKGCRDFFPRDMRVRNFIFDTMRKSAETFAFEGYDGPLLEEVDLYLAKSGEELITDQIYSFTDRGDRKVAIRPEMTPTVARMVAAVHKETPKPIKWYSIPNLMRYEKPQRGRLREHWQFNADVFGAEANLGEIEIFSLIVHMMEAFGANHSMFTILINDRRIVDALFNNILELSSNEAYKLYKVIDRAKKVSKDALHKMISEIISDISKIEILESYLSLTNFKDLEEFIGVHSLTAETEDFIHFYKKMKRLPLIEYMTYDPTIVRGLDYYTGVVFEVFDKHPDNRRALAGGGSYANLLQIFNESPLAGVGFGMGDVTLRDFLDTHKLLPDFTHANNQLFLAYLDDDCEQISLKVAHELRKLGTKVELNLGKLKFNKVFKLAQNKGHKFLAMIGSNEKEKEVITFKNLKTKENLDIKLTNIKEMIKYIEDKK